jgi:hypothetical protein
MGTFLFRCPTTGFSVQGWVDDASKDDDESYLTHQCPACLRIHLVNPKTGKVLGSKD